MYYGNNYLNNLQDMKNQIERQMNYMQNQPTPITQNFQIAPQGNNFELDGKYVDSIEDVKNTLALKETVFIAKDKTILWIKNTDGTIKPYSLTEIIELDEKDLEIKKLRDQIQELKEEMKNAKYDDKYVNESTATKKSANGKSNKSND